MDTKSQKTNIIINEILFWKQNKMLPDHYCDYLLALYNQGEDMENMDRKKSKRLPAVLFSSALFMSLIPFSLFVIYFTELSFVLQTAILTGFVVLLIFAAIYYSKKEIISPVIYITTAIIVLIYSVNFSDAIFQGDKLITYIILFCNCFLWSLAGLYFKMLYFTIAGAAGILILIISIVI
ncbi:hypothetical protein [Bacillus sp. SG-1]|uniref:hypothetical protein n=1 Tax=Bacillus sp. SG-1 TaxID=161544 RepID=UPI0001544DF5|nr:hypothetical protein [Bacillus sp. SG-1]EDL64462.1 hypothetical protein BSG1_06517 [Bacillus sp. SG-1]